MFKTILATIIATCFLGCSGDRSSDAQEATLHIVTSMGAFDPEKGRTFSTDIGVRLKGELYSFSLDEGATVIGLEDKDILFMNGAHLLVNGELADGVYHASYVEFLDDDSQGNAIGAGLEHDEAPLQSLEFKSELAPDPAADKPAE